MEYKGFTIVGDKSWGLKMVKRIGKGGLPSALTGLFTSEAEAKFAIDAHALTKGDTIDAEAVNAA